jgi:hypothetical protein
MCIDSIKMYHSNEFFFNPASCDPPFFNKHGLYAGVIRNIIMNSFFLWNWWGRCKIAQCCQPVWLLLLPSTAAISGACPLHRVPALAAPATVEHGAASANITCFEEFALGPFLHAPKD